MEKLTKTSAIINKILSVLFVLVIIAGVITLWLTMQAAIYSPEPNESISIISFRLGNVTLYSQDEILFKDFRFIYLYTLVLTAGSVLFACYTIILLKRIFSPMAQGLPFDSIVSMSLKKLAWTVLIFGILYTVLMAAMETTYFKIFDLANLLVNEHIQSVELNVVSDGNFIIGFVLLLLLSHVFRYGEQLQQLSDETL